MAYTISVHHGGGKANRNHNIRDGHAIKNQTHIDTAKPIEIWKDETEAQTYKRLFGEATNRYNGKQPRKERKIRSYHANVEKDAKLYTSYECIVEIGNRDHHLDPQTEKAILKRFVDEWQERNPNMELYGAYFHLDEEGGNHIHLDYIPVAHGYKRGLDTQTSLTKALEEMGYKGCAKLTAQTMWQNKERQALEDICKDFGIEIEHPMRDGKEAKRQHMETEQYKATKQLEETIQAVEANKEMAASIQGRIEEKQLKEESLDRKIAKKEQQLADIEGSVKEAKQFKKERKPHLWSKDEVTIPYEEYQSLQKTAKAIENVHKAQEDLDKRELELNRKEASIQPDLSLIEREKSRLKRKESQLDQYIETATKMNISARVSEVMGRTPTSYVKRLEDFLKQYHVKDGRTMLEVFQANERQFQKAFDQGLDR